MLVVSGMMLQAMRPAAVAPLPMMPAVANAPQGQGVAVAVPEATDKTREQKRFDRYDKDRDGSITRGEYLLPRTKAFAKLDTNHDGMLSFDEWAVKTENKFAMADKDKSGAMSPAEFLATAVKHKTHPRAKCPDKPAAPPAAEEAPEES